MPENFATGALLVGALLLLAAVLSGTFKLFGNEIPRVAGRTPRILVALFGAGLIIWSLLSSGQRPEVIASPPAAPDKPAASAETTTPATTDLAQAARRILAMCVIPSAPPRDPDGSRATRDEMKAGKQAIVDYNDAVVKYQACLETASNTLKAQHAGDPAAPDLTPIESVRVELNNTALDQLTARVERFNQQLRIFKARPQQ